MVLPPLDQLHKHVEVGDGVAVEADGDDVDDDPPLDPVLPVAEVELLGVHELEDLLGGEDEGGDDQQDPHHHRALRDPGTKRL